MLGANFQPRTSELPCPKSELEELRRVDRESAQFLKGLEAAQKRLKSFGASTRLVGTKLTGLGVAAAAPVGASLAVYTSFDDAIRAAGAARQCNGGDIGIASK